MTLRRPCSVCGKPNRGGNCPEHRWRRPPGRKRRRHNPAYDDPRYKQARRALFDQVELAMQTGMVVGCVICRKPILRMEDLSCEHDPPLREQSGEIQHRLSPSHKKCNSSRRRWS